MAVTLAQANIDTMPGVLERSLVTMFDYYSSVIKSIPMVKINGRHDDYERVITLPAVQWRALNQPYSESTGVTNPLREYLKILGGEVKSDVHFQRTAPTQAINSMTRQFDLKMQALANEWDRAFFEGSELADPDEMVGLRPRLSSGQLILNASGGGALTLAKLRSLRAAVPFSTQQRQGYKRGEGVRVCMYMNRTIFNKIEALLEAQTGSLRIETTRDAFGDDVQRFGGADLIVVEQTGTGATILDFDEDPGDATADTASIYCVAYGEGMVQGIYNNGNVGGRDKLWDVDEWDTQSTEPRALTRFEGSFGLKIEHPRAAARLYAITNA